MRADKSIRVAGAACIFIAALILVNANVESGMNDDWSFIRTVRDLATTGHLRYNGWSAPLIGLQAYWGALFVKLFGFSFLAVRASAWVLTIAAIPVLWQLLRSVDVSEGQAFFGLAAFLLSPLNLPNMATFMTDMPAFMLFAAALLAALKAWENGHLRWILVTTVCAFLSGSIRQIYWLSGICFLVVLAVVRVRSLRGRVVIGICIAVTVVLAMICSQWLAAQPYVPADDTVQAWKDQGFREIAQSLSDYGVRTLIGTALLSMPFTLLIAVPEIRRLRWWLDLPILAAAVTLAYVYSDPLPWLGNTLTRFGILLPGTLSVGERPEILSTPLVMILAFAGLVSGAYAAIGLFRSLPHSRFVALAAPFVIGYVMVLAIRAPGYGLYDRYLIPVVFVTGTVLLEVHARSSRAIGGLSWGAAALFAAYAIVTTHDYFAVDRAKLAATNEVMQTGVARGDILNGFEFDLWSEADLAGHINNDLVKFPANAYRETDDCNGADDVMAWWRPMTPDLKQRYVISISKLSDLRPTNFKPIEYWRWLPLRRSEVYVEQAEPPLSCHE